MYYFTSDRAKDVLLNFLVSVHDRYPRLKECSLKHLRIALFSDSSNSKTLQSWLLANAVSIIDSRFQSMNRTCVGQKFLITFLNKAMDASLQAAVIHIFIKNLDYCLSTSKGYRLLRELIIAFSNTKFNKFITKDHSKSVKYMLDQLNDYIKFWNNTYDLKNYTSSSEEDEIGKRTHRLTQPIAYVIEILLTRLGFYKDKYTVDIIYFAVIELNIKLTQNFVSTAARDKNIVWRLAKCTKGTEILKKSVLSSDAYEVFSLRSNLNYATKALGNDEAFSILNNLLNERFYELLQFNQLQQQQANLNWNNGREFPKWIIAPF